MHLMTPRAMLVSVLTQDQLEKLHALEKKRGYLIPTWNVLAMLNLPPLRKRYKIPQETELQVAHNQRIEREIAQLGLYTHRQKDEDWLDTDHAFDWNIFSNKDRIIWDYTGGGVRSGGRRLSELARGSGDDIS